MEYSYEQYLANWDTHHGSANRGEYKYEALGKEYSYTIHRMSRAEFEFRMNALENLLKKYKCAKTDNAREEIVADAYPLEVVLLI